MPKKLTTEEFIEKSKLVHGDKYDYNKVEYINAITKVCIICPIHGEFLRLPLNHLCSHGCPKCSFNKNSEIKRKTIDEFIQQSKEIHGDKYDYIKVEYKNARTKVCIICKKHGEFLQTANNHLSGQGCPKCANNIILTTEEFIKRARQVHDDKYDYSKVEYINSRTKVCIICKEHGEFWQEPSEHLNGQGCPKCANKNVTTEEFINKARLVHGNRYNYSKVEYINSITKVCIICSIHGEFWQTPHGHLSNKGCPKCAMSQLENNLLIFLEHNNIKYDFQKRFNWLGRQSLDFYIPSINVAIECQGIQHFGVGSWAIDRNNIPLINRDKRKKQLCEEHGVKLLYYTDLKEYDTFLDEPLIKTEEELFNKIKQYEKENINRDYI